jgi:hypothetical protein
MNGLDSIGRNHFSNRPSDLTANPYVAPSAEDTTIAPLAICCPKCERRIPYTWKRYLLNPQGFHTCPGCGLHGRIRMALRSHLFTTLALLAILLTPIYLNEFFRVLDGVMLFAVIAAGVIALLCIDRNLDTKRPFLPVESRSKY